MSSGGTTNRPVTGSPIARALFRLWNETRTKTSLPGSRPSRSCRAVKSVVSSAWGPTRRCDFLELLVVRPLDQHARGAVAAAPHHDRAIAGVTELQALQRLRALDLCSDDRRGLCRGPSWQRKTGGRCRGGLQEPSSRSELRASHGDLLSTLPHTCRRPSGATTVKGVCNGNDGKGNRPRKIATSAGNTFRGVRDVAPTLRGHYLDPLA